MPDRDAPAVEKVAVTIDGRTFDAAKGQLVIDAAEQHGVYIPRFCYHPRMQPVGMCRMCIVDIDTGRGPALQPACMIPVSDGMVVDTKAPGVQKAQDGVLEFLLINHPLDCPVCDKGGECPLQDQAYAYGPGESRFVEEKRHFEKPIPISGLVFLDRERCILCDRCTRFADEVAGDPLIHFMGRGAQSEVNTFPDHPFASYFSGNTVQICPVGALTAKPYRFRARPWDLDKVESTCTTCAVGCRVVVESSRNRLLRYQGVDSDPVNWGWLCDRGRFDFEYVNHDDRLSEPMVHTDGELVSATWSDALGHAADAIKRALDTTGPSGVAVLGGARLTNESAYAWAKLAKSVIGTDNVDAQLGDGLPAEAVLGLPRATIDDVCAQGGTVLLLAGDLKEELPVLFLRLRDAVVNRGVKVIELSPVATGFTRYAAASLRYRPGEAPEVVRALLGIGDGAPIEGSLADAARWLPPGQAVSVVLGRPTTTESADGIVDAAALILGHLPGSRFLSALRRGNVHGALDMGLAPGVLPGRVSLEDGRQWFGDAWGAVPADTGLDATGVLQAAADGRIDVLVLLGADPVGDFPDHDLAARAIAGARTVIAVDLFLTESSQKADVVLPAAGYAETTGTTTNLEGRVSTMEAKITPPGTARADWIIAADLAYRLGGDLGLESVEGILEEIAALAPSHQGVTADLLSLADGVVVPIDAATLAQADGVPVSIEGARIPTGPTDPTTPGAGGRDEPEPAAAQGEAAGHAAGTEDAESPEAEHAAADAAADASSDAVEQQEDEDAASAGGAEESVRPAVLTFVLKPNGARRDVPAVDAYSLRLIATRSLYDRGTTVQKSPSLADLLPGAMLRLNQYDFDRLGAKDNRVRITSSRATHTVPAAVDAAVPRGCAAIRINQDDVVDPYAFVDAAAPVTDVRVETA